MTFFLYFKSAFSYLSVGRFKDNKNVFHIIKIFIIYFMVWNKASMLLNNVFKKSSASINCLGK